MPDVEGYAAAVSTRAFDRIFRVVDSHVGVDDGFLWDDLERLDFPNSNGAWRLLGVEVPGAPTFAHTWAEFLDRVGTGLTRIQLYLSTADGRLFAGFVDGERYVLTTTLGSIVELVAAFSVAGPGSSIRETRPGAGSRVVVEGNRGDAGSLRLAVPLPAPALDLGVYGRVVAQDSGTTYVGPGIAAGSAIYLEEVSVLTRYDSRLIAGLFVADAAGEFTIIEINEVGRRKYMQFRMERNREIGS